MGSNAPLARCSYSPAQHSRAHTLTESCLGSASWIAVMLDPVALGHQIFRAPVEPGTGTGTGIGTGIGIGIGTGIGIDMSRPLKARLEPMNPNSPADAAAAAAMSCLSYTL